MDSRKSGSAAAVFETAGARSQSSHRKNRPGIARADVLAETRSGNCDSECEMKGARMDSRKSGSAAAVYETAGATTDTSHRNNRPGIARSDVLAETRSGNCDSECEMKGA